MKLLLLKTILRLHNLSYRYASVLAVKLEGRHPKHRIMRYKEWFVDRVKESDVVLDVGCHSGEMPAALSPKAAFVYGVEKDRKLLQRARDRHSFPNVVYVHADATRLDYSSFKPISVVTLSNVLEHIEGRVDFLRSLTQQIHWRSDGEARLLIRVPMITRDWITLYKKELGLEWRLDPTHFTEYSQESFMGELKAANLHAHSVDIRFGEIYAECRIDG